MYRDGRSPERQKRCVLLLFGHNYVLVGCSGISLLINKTVISQPELPEVHS